MMEEKPEKKDVDEAISYACSKMKVKELKTEQEKCVRAFVNGSDIFISLPTGYGKSLCFAILPHIFDHLRGLGCSKSSIVICVVPLLSLMADQYHRFKDCLSVVTVYSSSSKFPCQKWLMEMLNWFISALKHS